MSKKHKPIDITLFVDLDGVLADFDAGYEKHFGHRPDHKDDTDWDAIAAIPDFYLNLPPMPDAFELWEGIKRFKPIVLTGVPRSNVPSASANKRVWAAKHLGNVEVITTFSRDKCKHSGPGQVLIDDRPKCGVPWTIAGGIWIPHKDAKSSLFHLNQLTSEY